LRFRDIPMNANARDPWVGERRAPSRQRWIPYLLIVGLIAALVVGLASFAFWQEKERYRERATIATRNVAGLLDQHISDVFAKIDVVLRSVAFDYREQTARGPLEPAKFNARLAQQESLLPEVLSLRVLDKDGFVRFGSGIPSGRPVNLADREYFISARNDPSDRLLISGPILARINKQWVIVFARPLTTPNGAFAGLVYANLPTTHFDKVFSSVELGPRGAATIRTADLALVHRYPETRNAVGSKEVSKQLRDMVAAHPKGSDYLAATALDGIERSNAYRLLERFPFYVIVGIATDDYLGGWKRNVLMLSSLACLAILVTGFAAVMVYRATGRLAADIEERKRIGAELERLLAERTHLNAELAVRAEEAEAANRAKTAFLANMSHELRTPMNAIMGMTELAMRRTTDPKLIEQLKTSKQASDHLLGLINDVLDMSKAEAEHLRLAQTNFTLREVLDALLAAAGPKAAAKGLDLVVDVPDDLAGTTFLGDPLRLGQVMLNLTGNAVKFSDRGSIALCMRRVSDDAAGTMLHFEVRDSGIGIAPSAHERLFNAFEQADGSMTRKYGGAGLGLALSKRLVHLMGGTIGVESQPGMGSTFWFTVRLPVVADAKVAASR
jgi:signal transduction histidine kinase